MESSNEFEEQVKKKMSQSRGSAIHCMICGNPLYFSQSIRCPICVRLCCPNCVTSVIEDNIHRNICEICRREKFGFNKMITEKWKETLCVISLLSIILILFILRTRGIT